MSRFKAFSIHFAISFVIFLILLYFILVQWYPQPLFSTDGGWRVIRIIVGIDLVLGPLLTFIVYKPKKPGLKFDLSLIALLQTTALLIGVFIILKQHPVAIVYTSDHFIPVPAYQLKEQNITTKELKQFGDNWPLLIYSDVPEEELSEALAKSLREGKPLYLYHEYYKKLSKDLAPVFKTNSMELEKYVEDKPELRKRYQYSLLTRPDNANVSYLALHSREKWVTVVLDLDDMKIIDTIDIEPHAYNQAQEIKRKKVDKKEK